MSKRSSLIVTVVVAVVVVGVAIYLLSPGGGEGDQTTVQIAANLPLSGDLATFGTAVRDGAMMAVDDLAQQNGNADIDIAWQDNQGNPQEAVNIMQQQFLNSPDIYTSGLKPQTMAIIDQVAEEGTPHFVWIFDAFVNTSGMTNNFRPFVGYKREASAYLRYVEDKNAQKVAILYINLPHAQEEFNELVIPELKDRGIDVFSEAYAQDKQSFQDLALKVKEFNPDVIILNGFPVTLSGIVRALRPQGLIEDGNTIATYDMLNVGTFLGEDELQGIRVVAPEFVIADNQKVSRWREQFRKRYDSDPFYIHAYSYDMIQMINDAAQRLSLPASSADWVSALRQTDMEGVTGHLEFDEGGDLVTPLVVVKYENGRPVLDKNYDIE